MFSLLAKGKHLLDSIIDRFDQLKLSENVVTRIKEGLEYMQQIIRKIEPCVKKDIDIKELTEFLTQLENVSISCTDISEKHPVIKFATIPAIMHQLYTLEAEIKVAISKLMLFMAANHLTTFNESIDFQNKKLNKIAVLQENSNAGINIIIFQKAQSHISTVFGQFSYLSSFSQYMHPPGENKIPQSRPRLGLFLSSSTCSQQAKTRLWQKLQN